jgi:type VI secretion system ImpM family protein
MEQGVVLGYYGKLALSSEFIRHNAAGAEIQNLDRWFQQGIHHAKSRIQKTWSAEFQDAGFWNFLYVPERGTRVLIGMLTPGHDAAGREFPFFFFVRVERAYFRGAPWLLPLALEGFLSETERVIAKTERQRDLHALHSELQALSIPSFDVGETEKIYFQCLRDQNAGEFWRALLGDFSNPTKYYLDHWLRECLKPLSADPSRGLGWGLKLPLFPAGSGPYYDVSLWVDLMSRHLRSRLEPTLLLWNRAPSNARPCMIACFGTLIPNLVLFTVRPGLEDKTWFELAPDFNNKDSIVLGSVDGRRRAILDDADMSMESFLKVLGSS